MLENRDFTPQKLPFFSSILYQKNGIISKGIESENSDTNLCIKMRQTPASIVIQKGTYILKYICLLYQALVFVLYQVISVFFFKGEECKELNRGKDVKMIDEKTFLKIANLISQNCSIPQLKYLIKIEEKAIDNNREKLVKEYNDYVKKMQNI